MLLVIRQAQQTHDDPQPFVGQHVELGEQGELLVQMLQARHDAQPHADDGLDAMLVAGAREVGHARDRHGVAQRGRPIPGRRCLHGDFIRRQK